MSDSVFRGRDRRQRGSSLVESAVVLAVFFMLFFGVIDFGRAAFAFTQMSSLAELGARYASMHGSTAGTGNIADSTSIQTYVRGQTVGLDSSSITVTSTWQTTSKTPGEWVKVNVTYPFNFATAYMPMSGMSLGATAQNMIIR